MPHRAAQLCRFIFLVLRLVHANQECSYRCDECHADKYYFINESTGICTRNDREVGDYLVGQLLCGLNKAVLIRERGTCKEFEARVAGTDLPRYGYLQPLFRMRVEWNESTGCAIHGNAPRWFDDPFESPICLQTRNPLATVVALVVSFLLGCIIALLGYRCDRNALSHAFEEHEVHKEDFWPGAKLMAADHAVKGGGTRKLTFLFRSCQIIANVWLPTILSIFMSPTLTLPLYGLLYIIPGFCVVGAQLFLDPIYLVTPPDVSLFGIDHIQPDYTKTFLFHAIRPVIMVGGTFLSAAILANTLPRETQGFWTFNLSGYFRAGMMKGPTPTILAFVLLVCFIGTLIFMCMSVYLVLQAWLQQHPGGSISLVKAETKIKEITGIAHQICDVAVLKLNHKRTRADALKNLGITPLPSSKLAAWTAIVTILLQLSSKPWMIHSFIDSGRYILAGIIMCSSSESFFMLLFTGSLRGSGKAFRKACRDGVPSFEYLHCCSWDHGICGIPKLIVTVYGIPNSQTFPAHTWLGTMLAIVYICLDTWSVAKIISQSVDFDMFDVHPPDSLDEDTAHHSFTRYAQSLLTAEDTEPQSAEDSESQSEED